MRKFSFTPNKRTRDNFGRFAKVADRAVPAAAAAGVTYGAAKILRVGRKPSRKKKPSKLKAALQGSTLGAIAAGTYLTGRSAINQTGKALRKRNTAKKNFYRTTNKSAELTKLPLPRKIKKIKAISIR